MGATILSVASIILSIIALVVSSILVARQTTYLRHANQMPIMTDVIQEYRSTDFQNAQHYVVNSLAQENPPDSGTGSLPEKARQAVYVVTSFYGNLAVLVVHGILDEKLVILSLWHRINVSWDALEPYILREREMRGDPNHLAHYEDLVFRVRRALPSPVDYYGVTLNKLPRAE